MMESISWAFIRGRTCLSWMEAAWGYHNGYLGLEDIIELACGRVGAGEDDLALVKLAGLSKSESYGASGLLDSLASTSAHGDEAFTKAKWLYLKLAWLFENRATCADPLEAVEIIYSDFDYPEEVAPFVRYMPVTDGYDPSAHTLEQNEARLFAKWESYLATKAPIFAPTPGAHL